MTIVIGKSVKGDAKELLFSSNALPAEDPIKESITTNVGLCFLIS